MDSKKQSSSSRKTARRTGGEHPHEPAAVGARNSRSRLFITIGVVVVVLLAIVAVPYYQNYIAPFNKAIITIDGEEITVGYFLDRAEVAGADPMSMLESLTNEAVIKIMAPQYGIEVTEDDVDQELRNIASDDTGEISDIEFKEWYRQQLNENGVSDEQYRELVSISLLAERMQEYLAEQVPYEAEQVHLHIMIFSDYEEGLAAKARLDASEDFATVAREVSVDESSREAGGDLGWVPPAISLFEYQIDLLEINEISEVIPYYSSTYSTSSTSDSSEPDFYYILMVSGKEEDRLLTDEYRAVIQDSALDFWLSSEIPKHDITYDFTSETYAWLNWQLEKRTASD